MVVTLHLVVKDLEGETTDDQIRSHSRELIRARLGFARLGSLDKVVIENLEDVLTD